MAAEDYVVADRQVEGGFPVTAGDKVGETVQETPDAESRAAADTAGVSHPAYIGYVEALNAHQSRTDIETLADRRARTIGDSFSDGEFMRQRAYDDDGSAADAPRPGTVYGDAPASS